MRKIILLTVLTLLFSNIFAYGQEKADTQSIAVQSAEENKIFDEPLEKRVEEAVSGMKAYGMEVQKELESLEGKKEEKNIFFFSRLGQYVSNYVRDNSIRELLFLEGQILKRGYGPETIYGWFFTLVHGTVLKLAGYEYTSDIPISDKILEIIQDKTIDDYTRSKYVIDISGKFNDLHNKRKEVNNAVKEKIYPVLIKILDDTKNSSILRAEAAGALAFIGRNSEKITKYLVKLLDDNDDLVKDRTIWYCSLKDENIRKKITTILKNRNKYSEQIIERASMKLVREPDKTYDAIPYFLEMLKETQDKGEFKRIAMNLQKYNDPSVMGPIIRGVKERGLETDRELMYYFKNSLLLDYLPNVNDEDRLLVLNLIFDTSYQVYGNVETPPHFGKAINILKNYISSPNKEIQLVILRTYERIIESAKSNRIEHAQREGMSKLGDIEKILLENRENVNDSEVAKLTDSLLAKIEMLKR